MNRTEILQDEAVLRLGISRNLVICAWRDAPSASDVQAMSRAITRTARKYPGDFGVYSAVLRGTPKFSDEVRAELGKVVTDPNAQGRGAAHVIVLDGFAGTATRAFLNTIFLVGRAHASNKVFADHASAAAWLAPRLSAGQESWTVPQLLAAQGDVTV
jgi:hypothetical protein